MRHLLTKRKFGMVSRVSFILYDFINCFRMFGDVDTFFTMTKEKIENYKISANDVYLDILYIISCNDYVIENFQEEYILKTMEYFRKLNHNGYQHISCLEFSTRRDYLVRYSQSEGNCNHYNFTYNDDMLKNFSKEVSNSENIIKRNITATMIYNYIAAIREKTKENFFKTIK